MKRGRAVAVALLALAIAVTWSLCRAPSQPESAAERASVDEEQQTAAEVAEAEAVRDSPAAPDERPETRIAVNAPPPLPSPATTPRAVLAVEDERPEVVSWVLRVGDGTEFVPCAELLVQRHEADEVLCSDSTGRLKASIAETDRVALRIPAAAGFELPVRVDLRGPLGPTLRVELASVIVLAAPTAGEWTLVSTTSRVDSRSGRLLPALNGWRCGQDRVVFPVPGEVPNVASSDRGRVTFVARENGERVADLEVPWPCWASDGVQSLLRRPPSTASLHVALHSQDPSEGLGALQVTLKAADAPRSSPALAVEFAQLGSRVEFSDLEPRRVTVFVSGERVGLVQRTVDLAPGPNELDLVLSLGPAPLAFEVEVLSRNGKLEDGLFVTATSTQPGQARFDAPLHVRRGEDGQEQARASLALAVGEWRLRIYSASTGVTYISDHGVRAEDRRARLTIDAPAQLIGIRLADDSSVVGVDLWVDASGEGLRLTAVGAQPGGVMAEVPASAEAVTWVLSDERGPYQHGGLSDLRLKRSASGESEYVLSPMRVRSTTCAVRLTSGERGVEGSLDGRRSDRLGYVFLDGALGAEVLVEVEGKSRTVIGRYKHPWGTTLRLSP